MRGGGGDSGWVASMALLPNLFLSSGVWLGLVREWGLGIRGKEEWGGEDLEEEEGKEKKGEGDSEGKRWRGKGGGEEGRGDRKRD